MIEFYKNQQTFGLEKYFIEIEEWINPSDNSKENGLPLVIEAEEGVGKKTLLVKWMQYHQERSTQEFKDVIITHFGSAGGTNSNYFYAIYRILIKLREAFNINLKVELLEQKLVKNFEYWLRLCSQKATSSVVYDGKVVLIVEGLESFKDMGSNQESNIKFWFPKTFPKNIKVITTAAKNSKAYTYLKKIGCKIIQLRSDKQMMGDKITAMDSRNYFCTTEHRDKILSVVNGRIKIGKISSLFMKTTLACFTPYVSKGIIHEGEVDSQTIQEILSKLNIQDLRDLADTE